MLISLSACRVKNVFSFRIHWIVLVLILTSISVKISAQNKYLIKKVKGIYTTVPELFDQAYKFENMSLGQGVYFDVKKADLALAGIDTTGISAVMPAKNGMWAGIMNGYGRFLVPPEYTVVQKYGTYRYLMGKKLRNGMWKVELVELSDERLYQRFYYPENKDYRYLYHNNLLFQDKDGKLGLMNCEGELVVEAKFDDFQIIGKDLNLIDKSKLPYNSIEQFYVTNINTINEGNLGSGHFIEFINSEGKTLVSGKNIIPNYTKLSFHKLDGTYEFYYVENNLGADLIHTWNKDFMAQNRMRMFELARGNNMAASGNQQKPEDIIKGRYIDIVWKESDGTAYRSRNNFGDMLVIKVDSANQLSIDLNFVGNEGWTASHDMEYKLMARGVEVTAGVIQPGDFEIGAKPVNGYFLSMGNFTTEYKLGRIKSISGWYKPSTKELHLTGERHGYAGALVITAKHE